MVIDPRPARLWPIPPMDHGSGHKDTAFTWAMGKLILQRIADGETVKAITADPRMPAYCTVFQWMKVVPEFGDAVRAVRDELARMRIARREAEAAARGLAVVRARAEGRKVRWWTSGRKSTYDPLWAEAVLLEVAAGAVLSHVLARPRMPSPKAWYRWLKIVPGLAERYGDACIWRRCHLEAARERAIDGVFATGIPAANAAIRRAEGRMGRLEPKTYRFAPPLPEEGPSS